jgi:hypothetical protein
LNEKGDSSTGFKQGTEIWETEKKKRREQEVRENVRAAGAVFDGVRFFAALCAEAVRHDHDGPILLVA